jgi:hypothetical protein
MVYPFPQGTLSITEATERLVRFKNYEWTKQEAWRSICEGILKGIIPAYVMNSGRSHDADRAQFAALGDQEPMMLHFRQFASTTLGSLDASCFPRKALIPGMARISPPVFDVQARHVYGQIFFLESDFDAAWWESMEPKNRVEAVAWLRGKYRSPRPVIRRTNLLQIVMDEGGFRPLSIPSMDRAIAMAWPGSQNVTM